MTAFRQKVTTRFELRNFSGEAFTGVRWYLDGVKLDGNSGSRQVNFEPIDTIEAPPEDAFASNYAGGAGTLQFTINGSVLEITNDPANGVFFGNVQVLFSFPGDPPLNEAALLSEAIRSGYDRSTPVTVIAVDLIMDQEYREHVSQCKRLVEWVDRKRIPVNFGKLKVNPGDPPPYRESLTEAVRIASDISTAVGLEIGAARRVAGRQ